MLLGHLHVRTRGTSCRPPDECVLFGSMTNASTKCWQEQRQIGLASAARTGDSFSVATGGSGLQQARPNVNSCAPCDLVCRPLHAVRWPSRARSWPRFVAPVCRPRCARARCPAWQRLRSARACGARRHGRRGGPARPWWRRVCGSMTQRSCCIAGTSFVEARTGSLYPFSCRAQSIVSTRQMARWRTLQSVPPTCWLARRARAFVSRWCSRVRCVR